MKFVLLQHAAELRSAESQSNLRSGFPIAVCESRRNSRVQLGSVLSLASGFLGKNSGTILNQF